jgi:uncharacterized protein YkwD
MILAGCATSGTPFVTRPAVDAPPVIEPLAPAVTFGPVAQPAERYEEPLATQPAPDPISDEIYAGLPQAARDPRLDLAAAELAEVSAQGVSLADDVVAFALHAHGVVEHGQVFVAFGATAGDRLHDVLPGLGDRLAYPNARVGIGGRADRSVLVVAYTTPAHLIGVPRNVPGGFELHFKLDRPYEKPHVTVTSNDGSVTNSSIRLVDGVYRASIPCLHPGEQWISLTAADTPAPLAVVPIGCRQPPEPTFRVEPDVNLKTTDIARRLTALINRERLAAGLAPLSADPAATLAAQRYTEVMRRHRDPAHDLESSTPNTRLAAFGRIPPLLDETTLVADDLRHATDDLLDDPMYRKQVVTPETTHLGLGVTFGPGGELFAVIDYLQIHPAVDPIALEITTTQQILTSGRTRRTVKGPVGRGVKLKTYVEGPPKIDPDLTKLARRYAADLARGWRSDSVAAAATTAFREETQRYKAITRVIDQGEKDWRTELQPGQVVDNIGVGVAQAARDGALCGRVFRVVLVAHY